MDHRSSYQPLPEACIGDSVNVGLHREDQEL